MLFSYFFLDNDLAYAIIRLMVRLTKEESRTITKKAVRSGALQRPLMCDKCDKGNGPKQGIHAHHKDYNKPFDIVWLCANCHGKEHQRLNWENGLGNSDRLVFKHKHVRLPVLKGSPFERRGLLVDRSAVDEHEYYKEHIDLEEHLKDLFKSLTVRQRIVIKWRYGLGGKRGLTLLEVGKKLYLSRERVRQIQETALKRLKRIVAQKRFPLDIAQI